MGNFHKNVHFGPELGFVSTYGLLWFDFEKSNFGGETGYGGFQAVLAVLGVFSENVHGEKKILKIGPFLPFSVSICRTVVVRHHWAKTEK